MGMSKNNHYVKFLPNSHGKFEDGIKIRLAIPTDANDISKIEVNVYGEYPEFHEQVIKKITKAIKSQEFDESFKKTWVALKDGKIIGFSKSCFHNTINDFPDLIEGWYLNGITIHPDWRRIGIGKLLTETRMTWLKNKTNEVYYWSNKKNKASKSLHEIFGFKEIKSSIYAPMGYSNKSWNEKGFSKLFKAIIN
jgi:GNAT superfamily N-acetyltransferase